jgi:hypothetical protein
MGSRMLNGKYCSGDCARSYRAGFLEGHAGAAATAEERDALLVEALERRPIPPSSSEVFRALGDPVRWMDRYREWYRETRDLIAAAQPKHAAQEGEAR